jgi:3-hydroxyisobutyrate dehydrogenase
VDAPVSGGITAAAAGTLTFMVGAEDQNIFNEAKSILENMGKNVINCRKPGAG